MALDDRLASRSERVREERGAAAIEFALVFPLFVMLTFGMISAGFAFYYDIQLTQAARDAARFGSTFDTGELGVNAGLNEIAKIAARQTGWASPNEITDNGYICVAYIVGSTKQGMECRPEGCDPPGDFECADDDPSGDDPRVQVVINRDSEINAILFGWDVTLGTTTIIPWERRETPS